MTRLLDKDPLMGIETHFEYHHENDSFSLHTVQQTDDIVDANKRAHNGAASGWRGDMHRVASIPMLKYLELQRAGILDDEAAFRRWLNDPENKYFRTKGGRV